MPRDAPRPLPTTPCARSVRSARTGLDVSGHAKVLVIVAGEGGLQGVVVVVGG